MTRTSKAPKPAPAQRTEDPDSRFGPSDLSDTASESPHQGLEDQTDAEGTGARPGALPPYRGPDEEPDDIEPDESVDADEAGLAYTPPDPARNGGRRR